MSTRPRVESEKHGTYLLSSVTKPDHFFENSFGMHNIPAARIFEIEDRFPFSLTHTHIKAPKLSLIFILFYFLPTTQFLSLIIFDPFIDLFITLCIMVNTLFMALDHHDMDPAMSNTLKNGNYVSVQSSILCRWPYLYSSEVFFSLSLSIYITSLPFSLIHSLLVFHCNLCH